jgi:hypothetical protein
MGTCRPIRSLVRKDERATERIQIFQMTLRLRTTAMRLPYGWDLFRANRSQMCCARAVVPTGLPL